MDVIGGIDAFKKDQTGLAAVSWVSAGLGLVSIYLLFSSFVLVGLVVFVAALALSALISSLQDPPHRDWIGKCVFGRYPESIKYSSADDEIKAFQSI
jgi:hypothetical protein